MRAIRPSSQTRSAALRAACRLKPAFQAGGATRRAARPGFGPFPYSGSPMLMGSGSTSLTAQRPEFMSLRKMLPL